MHPIVPHAPGSDADAELASLAERFGMTVPSRPIAMLEVRPEPAPAGAGKRRRLRERVIFEVGQPLPDGYIDTAPRRRAVVDAILINSGSYAIVMAVAGAVLSDRIFIGLNDQPRVTCFDEIDSLSGEDTRLGYHEVGDDDGR